jgi:hypothetical protein
VFGFSKGAVAPLEKPEACSCGYGSDGHVVTSLPWPVVVLVLNLAVATALGRLVALVSALPYVPVGFAPGRRRERSGKAPIPACGRMRPP